MDLGKKGVFCFTDALNPAQLIELAQRTEQLGYSALWYPEALGYESFALGGFLLARTKNLIIASGIANIYARDAAATKQGHHSLAKLYGAGFCWGWASPMSRSSRRPVVTSTSSLSEPCGLIWRGWTRRYRLRRRSTNLRRWCWRR
jgi:hypothetical protein